MGNYTLQQAQNDIADLRGQIAHMQAYNEVLQLIIDTSLTLNGTLGGGWTSIILDTGWSAGAITPRYRLLAKNILQLSGQATRSGIAGSANLNNSNPLAASFRPTATVDFDPYYDTGFNRAHGSMNSSGVITASSVGTVTGTWFLELNCIIPLD